MRTVKIAGLSCRGTKAGHTQPRTVHLRHGSARLMHMQIETDPDIIFLYNIYIEVFIVLHVYISIYICVLCMFRIIDKSRYIYIHIYIYIDIR